MLRRGRWGTGSYPCLKPALTFAHVTDDPGRVLLFILLPGFRPALGGEGGTQGPLLLSSPCSHPAHTPSRLALLSQAALSPWPTGTGARRSAHSQWEQAEEHTGAPSTTLVSCS